MRVVTSLIAVIMIAALSFVGYHYVTKKPTGIDMLDARLGLGESAKSAKLDQRAAYFTKLAASSFTDPDGTEFNIDTVIGDLPEAVLVTYGAQKFNPETGASELSDMKITAAENTEVGVKISSLKIWGGNEQAFTALFSGTHAQTVTSVASRVEASGISLFGLETTMKGVIDATNDITTGMIEEIDPGLDAEELRQSIDDYDVSIGRLVFSNLTHHPVTLKLIEPKADIITDQDDDALCAESGIATDQCDDQNELATMIADTDDSFHALQKMAAWSGAISFDDFAAFDTTLSFDMTQADEKMALAMKVALLGYQTYDRGNVDLAIMTDLDWRLKGNFASDVTPADAPYEMEMTGTTALYVIEDMRLAKAYAHMAKGEMPEVTNTDFLSLGRWTSQDTSYKMADIEVYSVASTFLDLTQFHGLVPTKIHLTFDDLSYNISGFMEMAAMMEGDDPDMPSSSELAEMKPFLDVLEKHGLGAPSMDIDYNLNWNPDNGGFDGTSLFDVHGFMRFNGETKATLTDYTSLMSVLRPAQEQTELDKEALQEMLLETLALEKYSYLITDTGGLTKAFAIASDMGQLMPEGDPSSIVFKNSSPEQLRTMASSGIFMAGSSLAAEFPPAQAYLKAVSAFIAKGGSLKLELAPETPLTVAKFQGLEDAEEPIAIVETLGLRVSHMPPGQ